MVMRNGKIHGSGSKPEQVAEGGRGHMVPCTGQLQGWQTKNQGKELRREEELEVFYGTRKSVWYQQLSFA